MKKSTMRALVKVQALTAADLKVGKAYRGKRFVGSPTFNNDRTIVWIGIDQVQYDSDTVLIGRKLPRVSIEAFLRWAKRELSQEEIDIYYGRASAT